MHKHTLIFKQITLFTRRQTKQNKINKQTTTITKQFFKTKHVGKAEIQKGRNPKRQITSEFSSSDARLMNHSCHLHTYMQHGQQENKPRFSQILAINYKMSA